MTDPRRQRFAPYLRTLADAIGLRDWRVEMRDDEPEGDHAYASVVMTYGRRHAVVRVSDQFLDETPEEHRHLLTHELVHAHFEPAWSIALDGLGDAARPAFTRMAEYAIDAIAEALAPHLPLHLETPTPEDDAMPKGTKVDKVYTALKKKGMSKSSAAAISQSVTHQSLATGKKTTKAGKKVAPKGIRRKKKG